MTEPPQPAARGAEPAVDVIAVLAAMQDQIDDLTAAVEAQQHTIEELVRAQPPAWARPPGNRAGGH